VLLGEVPNVSKNSAFETSETTHPTAQRDIQDGSNSQQQSCKNIKTDEVLLIYAFGNF
jgi:hypothetical protein